MKFLLPFTVCITGACVLILELIFMRILAPYFGNTTYTTSGTITVILLALSVGYKLGGKIADKYNSSAVFYKLIVLSAILAAISHMAMGPLLPILSNTLPLDVGPLLAGLLFMLIPNVIFGMLSPFAIKLQTTQISKSGNVAGSIYFWSTLGSIAGSLITTFYLIPYVGLDTSLRITYITIFALGTLGLLISKNRSTLLLIAIPLMFLSSQSQSFSTNDTTISIDGVYEKILIQDITYEGRPTRTLNQNTNASAAIFKDGPELVFEYTKYLNLIPDFIPAPTTALALGSGAYTIPKWLYQEYPSLSIDAVDIEPKLEEISIKYFDLPQTSQIKTHVDDGRRFLLHTPNLYDIVFADMYSSRHGVPSHTTTKEFFSLLNSKTNTTGIVMINLIGNLSDPSSPILPVVSTMRSVFPHLLIFGVTSPTENIHQNIIVIASKTPLPTSGPAWDTYAPHQIFENTLSLDKYPILTDDKNPIDLLYAQAL